MHRLSVLLCLLLLFCAKPAAAQTAIHRCIGANGNPVFTDQPCTTLQATPVAPATTASTATSLPQPAAAPPVLCAASYGQLRQNVINAFASRDANRLAGLMLWGGYGRGAAIADIRSIGTLMRQPLLDISPTADAPTASNDSPAPAGSSAPPAGSNAPATTPADSNQLVLHMAGNDGGDSPRELRFEIVRRAGCLWLRNAD